MIRYCKVVVLTVHCGPGYVRSSHSKQSVKYQFLSFVLTVYTKVSFFLSRPHPVSHCLGSKSVEIPLLVYGVSAATTTFACLATVLALPVHAPPLPPPLIGSLALTPEQRTILLAVYTPYIIVPIFIACDMAGRLSQRGNMNTKKLY